MQPVQDILHRIQWDPDFADADFAIGYYDRVENCLIQVPFAAMSFPADDRFAFELHDVDGEIRRVPFHRVREIHRNGRRIWSRGAD